jgi:hypothetical protein
LGEKAKHGTIIYQSTLVEEIHFDEDQAEKTLTKTLILLGILQN